ncbi:RND multidrug efflux membrane fusion protein MexE precursor [Sulfuriferula multivorans]|uniref:RND multidrug efflux membrane fusion protein MexE n=1 Tax=Sulfuriferula multivorans TaxID=1559896 RepID=A0A401JEG8_9PROT|nr:efflux RND transporter periplasmic adaptor subunit [Sulfuriferula multivorans]GBL46016.1 RND multidrug efflux membrane fusion protein MexE precursor [Sulfuriferula multivorans]
MKALWALVFLLGCTSALAGEATRLHGIPLTTPVSGVVKSVFVSVGQRVKKGQPLVALDDTIYQARVMEAEAGVARAKEEGLDAERDLARAKELYSRAVSSTTELDAAKLRNARADAMTKEAQARLIIARKNQQDSILRAPFDGVVNARLVEPGMYVATTLQPPTLIVLEKR